MKPIIPFALLGALLAVGANAAVTDPVGYITVPISGNATSNPSGAVTFVSASVTTVIEYASAATASPSGGSVVALPSGVPATLDGTYVLEITGGDNEGWWSPVVSSDDTSITVSDTFPDGLDAAVGVSVRKFDTLNSILGADNAAGLDGLDTPEDTETDFVNILNPMTQVPTTYFYVTDAVVGEGNGGWFDFVTQAPAGDVAVDPGSAVQVVRNQADPLSLVMTGAVKTTATQLDVFPNSNWLGQPLGAGGTLGEMEFATQLIAFDNGVTANDFLNVVGPDSGAGQGVTSYIALDPSVGGPGMFDFVLQTPADGVVIPEGSGYVVQRDAGAAPSIVTVPAVVIAP